ncbi:MAG: acyl carrier protein [Fimbriimonadaceae bacterium]|nr:acyl carrier protein [Fimbriimonadaceae bacterium]
MSETTFDRVVRLTRQNLKVSEETTITEATRFQDDLGADSLDVVELVMAVEEEFGVNIPDDATTGLSTVGDVVAYIDQHI